MKPNRPNPYETPGRPKTNVEYASEQWVKHEPGQAVFAKFVALFCLFLGSLYFWLPTVLQYIAGAR